MTTLRNASWWMVWVALVALLGVQAFDIKQDNIAYREIKGALRVRPHDVMEKLQEIEAELKRRDTLFDQLRERGLVTSGGKCSRCQGKM